MKKAGTNTICCLGGGKMGEALMRGLLESGAYARGKIRVGERDRKRRTEIEKGLGVRALASNAEALSGADVCVLAVKPQDMGPVLEEIGPHLGPRTLVISIAAGISTEWMRERLGEAVRIVRAMPNAPALVRQGTTGLFFGAGTTARDRRAALAIFEAVGATVVVEKEDHLNIITGLSGSGPGYVFLFLEALTDAGVYLGLARDVAARLALNTVLGSATMAQALERPFPLLRELITSPGGTTIAGLKVLEEAALRATVIEAVEAATQRSRELSV